MNELICTICFSCKPRFLRQCRCLYCEPCRSRSQEVCACGGTGGWLDLSHECPDEIKMIGMDQTDMLKRTMESVVSKFISTMQTTFGSLHNALELKAHHQKQLQKFIMTKMQILKQQNDELRSQLMQRKETVQPQPSPYDRRILDSTPRNFCQQPEEAKYSTPRGMRPVIPLQKNHKKPFEHEGFSNFFKYT
ncbi:unnamed protein product [Blepharisma stoltei]|uniref:Uncharacterized protein n=1 Tax=Blepharisma stoltei TaxID=1481888 RepID=A0AAU9J8J1_9CILI|nr:unnamed protein product [Blepharisma stoltei]